MISRIAAAVPVLVFWIEKIVMKERAITIVLIEPTWNRNCFLLVSWFEISDERTAACPEPKPGRKEARGAVRDVAMDDFRIDFFWRLRDLIVEIFC